MLIKLTSTDNGTLAENRNNGEYIGHFKNLIDAIQSLKITIFYNINPNQPAGISVYYAE